MARTWRARQKLVILGFVRLFACALVVALGVTACESYVRRGSTLYADGRYIEAAEVFERTENRLGDATDRERAEYGLYRGMTLLVLGDLKNARRWLSYAYEIERRNPGTLRADRRALLDRGWFELGQRSRSGSDGLGDGPQSAIAKHQQTPEDPPASPSPEPRRGLDGASPEARAPSEPGVRSVAPQNERSLVPH